jgi:hypothetical protein
MVSRPVSRIDMSATHRFATCAGRIANPHKGIRLGVGPKANRLIEPNPAGAVGELFNQRRTKLGHRRSLIKCSEVVPASVYFYQSSLHALAYR